MQKAATACPMARGSRNAGPAPRCPKSRPANTIRFFVHCAGLGEIVRTYTTVSRQGGKLKLLNLTKRIQDLLAITKLLTVFDTYDSEAEAIKSYK